MSSPRADDATAAEIEIARETKDDAKPIDPPIASASSGRRGSGIISWLIVIGGLGALAAYLVLSKPPTLDQTAGPQTTPEVQVTERGTLRVPGSGPFAQQLRRVAITGRATSDPVLEATGTLAAALPAKGDDQSPVRWQFATAEMLATYAELLQADSDVAFQTRSRKTTQALHDAKIDAQIKVVDRLRKLVDIGSEPARDLAAEEAALAERKLERDRELHEVDNAIKAAQRKQAELVHKLEQKGLPPDVLRRAKPGQAIVVAEISEARMDAVREGQASIIRFVGHADRPRTGKVASVLPTVTAAQRTVRVAILLDDPDATLRPGMFATVGIGTEPRDSIVIPANAVLHVGRTDYVLVGGGDELAITPVVLGETRGPDVEVVSGLSAGSSVVTDGAILLKPIVVSALAQRERK